MSIFGWTVRNTGPLPACSTATSTLTRLATWATTPSTLPPSAATLTSCPSRKVFNIRLRAYSLRIALGELGALEPLGGHAERRLLGVLRFPPLAASPAGLVVAAGDLVPRRAPRGFPALDGLRRSLPFARVAHRVLPSPCPGPGVSMRCRAIATATSKLSSPRDC